MKKLYILVYVFLLILLSSVSAVTPSYTYPTDEDFSKQVISAYSFDTDCKSELNNEDIGCTNNSIVIVTGNVSNAYYLNGETAWVNLTSDDRFNNMSSLSFYAKIPTQIAPGFTGAIVQRKSDTSGKGATWIGSTATISFNNGDDAVDCVVSNPNEWHFFIMTQLDDANLTIYVDGVQCASKIDTGFDDFWNIPTKDVYIGGLGIANRYVNLTIDELGIWNITFNSETDALNLTNYYRSGGNIIPSAPPPPTTATSTPTIVAPSPPDNANNNTNVTLNVTHATGNNDVRYYLFFGNTSTLNEGYYYLFNSTRDGDEYKSFLMNVSDGIYYYKWKVQNISSGVFSANTTQRTWTLDTLIPAISFGNNNNFSTNNLTIVSSYLSNLSINISFFDINLYQTLINVTNSTGETVYSILNTSITGVTANYSRIIDTSTLTLGDYTIRLTGTDSHTAEEILPYDINTGLSYFRYTTEEGNIIKIKSDTLPLTKRTNKLKDRYDFEFNYLFQKDTYKFIIESYNKIDYIEDSDYNAHFVVMGSNGKGNWIDFENPNLSKKDYKVTKIDDYTYEIEVTANGIKNFAFSSLGGLNTVEQHYKLRIGAVLDVWVFDEENYPVQINATATIGTQSANSTTKVSGARLLNITKEITSLTLVSSGFGTEIETISVTQSYHNLSFNMSPVSAAKLYFYDESSNALIAGEIFSVYLETTGFSQTYSGINSTSDNPYTITSLPNGLYKLKASSVNYLERQYLDLNISNITTTNLNIYLINSTLGSEITFNIVDEGLNPLKDVRAVFTKIINGTNTVIAEEDSDFAGQVILYLDSNVQYTINFSKTNYEDQTIKLEPKNSEYVIKMISTIGKYNQSVYEGLRYKFEPSNTVLNNNTKYNFTFTLNSSVWTVTNCTLKLFNGTSILLNENSSFTPNSCYLRIEQDTFSMTNITVEGIYELDSTYEFTVTQQYRVLYTYEGEFSLKNFLDDLSDFAMAGFDSFGRMMLALIVIFIITTLAAQKIGFTNPEVLIFLVIAQVWLFSYVNWLYLDFAPIPTIAGFDLKKYIIAILISLAGGAFVMRKFTD